MIAERSMISSRPLCRDYAMNELFETDLPGVLAREVVIIHSDKGLSRGGEQCMLGEQGNQSGWGNDKNRKGGVGGAFLSFSREC